MSKGGVVRSTEIWRLGMVRKKELLNFTDALSRLDNDKDLYCEICEIFLEEIREQVQEIRLRNENFAVEKEELARTFHSICGAAANVGAEQLAESSSELEGDVRKLESVGLKAFELEEYFALVDKTLNEIRAKTKPS